MNELNNGMGEHANCIFHEDRLTRIFGDNGAEESIGLVECLAGNSRMDGVFISCFIFGQRVLSKPVSFLRHWSRRRVRFFCDQWGGLAMVDGRGKIPMEKCGSFYIQKMASFVSTIFGFGNHLHLWIRWPARLHQSSDSSQNDAQPLIYCPILRREVDQ